MAGLGDVVGVVLGWLGYQVGLRTDVADATGSLHAKVAEAKNYIDASIATRQKPRGPVNIPQSFSTNSTSYVTAYEVSGKGRLVGFAIFVANSDSGGGIRIKITVDGYVVVSDVAGIATNALQYPTDSFLAGADAAIVNTFANGGGYRNGELNFKSSLKIEIYNTAGAYTYLRWYAELE